MPRLAANAPRRRAQGDSGAPVGANRTAARAEPSRARAAPESVIFPAGPSGREPITISSAAGSGSPTTVAPGIEFPGVAHIGERQRGAPSGEQPSQRQRVVVVWGSVVGDEDRLGHE